MFDLHLIGNVTTNPHLVHHLVLLLCAGVRQSKKCHPFLHQTQRRPVFMGTAPMTQKAFMLVLVHLLQWSHRFGYCSVFQVSLAYLLLCHRRMTKFDPREHLHSHVLHPVHALPNLSCCNDSPSSFFFSFAAFSSSSPEVFSSSCCFCFFF